jgi:hypothetical protein
MTEASSTHELAKAYIERVLAIQREFGIQVELDAASYEESVAAAEQIQLVATGRASLAA